MKPSLGRIVHFAPPQECVGPASPTTYPAIITQVNPGAPRAGDYGGSDETVELATFGPNSLYFQHAIPFSETAMPGHWTWPPKI